MTPLVSAWSGKTLGPPTFRDRRPLAASIASRIIAASIRNRGQRGGDGGGHLLAPVDVAALDAEVGRRRLVRPLAQHERSADVELVELRIEFQERRGERLEIGRRLRAAEDDDVVPLGVAPL